jgi:dTMP kinase
MGKLFVIEGTDGSGKQTQSTLLQQRLKEKNIDFKSVSFPNYENDSSALVKMYLNGEFGTDAKKISPYIASTFFAADRYATYKRYLEEYYENGGIIIADRYTTSNMVHQAGKIRDKKERDKFIEWLWDFEFKLYELPIPTEVFFLNMPIEYSEKLMKDRENKITHETKKDIHEKDEEYLKESYEAACELSKQYKWTEIQCVKYNQIRTIEDINDEILQNVLKHIN